jgi:acid phosphatase
MRRIGLVLLLCSFMAQAQVAVSPVAGEPVNLDAVKKKLIAYHDCSKPECYGPQIDRQSDRAIAMLKASVAKARTGEKLALVLDIDETSLSNWTQEQQDDFGYVSADWNAWVAKRAAPAIAGTLRVYKEAEKDHVAVFFITGRGEAQRADTEANLKASGYTTWDGLALRAKDHPRTETTVDYKSGERKKVVAKGYRLVLNMGDQFSDLKGEPMAEHSIKLPNPFYFIP